jgi:membrane protein DedA with SNARE-associated domain
MTNPCGLFVRSIQTRMRGHGSGPEPAAGRAGIVLWPMLVLASISESLFNVASHFVRDTGLPAVFVLMLAESACVPIPSEATMLFAGFAVTDPAAGHHHLTLVGIVVAGVLVNLVGSWIAYGVGRYGRIELVERHGHWLHVKPSQIEWADRWFQRYGAPAVFFSRMLPIIRTFISLPAGVAKMPCGKFTLLTLAGCGPWVVGLALAGETLGSEWKTARQAFEYIDYAVVVLVVLAIANAIIRRRRRRRDSGDPAPDAAG